jgi:trimethylamine:corrinoid methyltransferase-like protein
MLMDVEIFRRCARLHEGIHTPADRWLDSVVAEVGPGGNFLNQKSTLQSLRDGKFYLSEMGFHDTYENWKKAGMPDIVDQIQEVTRKVLKNHQPLPLDPHADRELVRLESRVRSETG